MISYIEIDSEAPDTPLVYLTDPGCGFKLSKAKQICVDNLNDNLEDAMQSLQEHVSDMNAYMDDVQSIKQQILAVENLTTKNYKRYLASE